MMGSWRRARGAAGAGDEQNRNDGRDENSHAHGTVRQSNERTAGASPPMRAFIVAIDAPRPSMHMSGGKPTLVPHVTCAALPHESRDRAQRYLRRGCKRM
jgi:hypothetical protein